MKEWSVETLPIDLLTVAALSRRTRQLRITHLGSLVWSFWSQVIIHHLELIMIVSKESWCKLHHHHFEHIFPLPINIAGYIEPERAGSLRHWYSTAACGRLGRGRGLSNQNHNHCNQLWWYYLNFFLVICIGAKLCSNLMSSTTAKLVKGPQTRSWGPEGPLNF